MGNVFGMSGMAIAVVTTIALMFKLKEQIQTGGMGFGLVLLGVVVGGAIGTIAARRSR
jgi:NAD(P) transhydrogenase subunit beta